MAATDQSSPYFDRLRRYLASSEPTVSGWYDAHCPLHNDDKRSAGFNFRTGQWKCQTSCGGGTLRGLIDRIDAREANDFIPMEGETSTNGDSPFVGVDDAEVIDIQTRQRRRSRRGRPAPTQEEIDAWVERLANDDSLLSRFCDRRGLGPKTLLAYEIGWSDEDGAYTIPIKSAEGELLNVRLYRIEDQAGSTKIWSWGAEGMDPNAIFPERVLAENDKVVIAEGEWDALFNNQMGIPTITGTTGSKQWMAKWNRKFAGKDVFVCYDRDKSGDDGADKVARNLDGVARSVQLVTLPMSWREKNGEDITDFYYVYKRSADDFRALMGDAQVYAAPKDGAAVDVSVKESYNPALSGKPMSMTVTVVGKSNNKHLLPHQVSFACSMNADKLCANCPMFDNDGNMDLEIASEDPVVLRLRDVSDKVRDEELRVHLGAHKCGRMDLTVRSFFTTETLLVRTSLDHADVEGDTASRAIINVGEYATEANRIVRLVGTTYPSPKDQESVFQAWQLDPVESSLDTYEVSDEDAEIMSVFRTDKGETSLHRLQSIAKDMSDNVTRIVGRIELHMAMDLVWHSALAFDFGGETIERGWLELLVVGDARTGKSEVATKLSRHYGFGRVVSCESASIPGLLGAVKPMPGGKAWTLEWGAIPLNDRRLIVLDEAGGLTHDQIGQLSSVRSSGRAEIIKAEREETSARTRLIWLSNPRENRHGMAGYMYGIRAIPPLIGNQEDIARFDFAMTVSSNDVDLDRINRRQARRPRHIYTADACHRLVRWVWSRGRDEVVWMVSAEDKVYAESKRLGKAYVADPPLIQGQNVRTKIARLAVAIAARTFSTDPTNTKIVVQVEHVESAVTFLEHIYSMDGFGYWEISKRARADEDAAASMMDDVKEYLFGRPGLAQFFIAVGGQFRRQQMEEMLNYNREEANLVIQKLTTMRMIQSSSDWDYRVLPHLNTVLREISKQETEE